MEQKTGVRLPTDRSLRKTQDFCNKICTPGFSRLPVVAEVSRNSRSFCSIFCKRSALSSLINPGFRFLSRFFVPLIPKPQIRRRHSGKTLDDVIEGTYEIVEELPAIAGKVQVFNQIELKPSEQEAFAAAALGLRWDTGNTPITSQQLLQPRRQEDNKNDLWTTYQRIQENMLKGGQPGRASTGRRLTTRAVKSVDDDIKINKALWLLTERMAQLKAA